MHSRTVTAPGGTAPLRCPPDGAPPNAEPCPHDLPDRMAGAPAFKVFTPDFPSEELDRQFLAAMAAGGHRALERLHLAYFPLLARFFRYLTATPATEVIEDLIADTLFDVWRSSATFSRETSVYVSIMRFAYAHGRKRLAEGEPRQADLPSLSEPSDQNGWLASRSGATRDLPEVFALLGVAERAVVYLVYSGHSRQEVMNILGMSREALDAHLASSMMVLRHLQEVRTSKSALPD